MEFSIVFIFLFLYKETYCNDYYNTWAGNTIHCRDNEFRPVKWWYVYKAPSGTDYPMDDGRNFSYISSDEYGKWITPHVCVSNSMLQNTLAPLYKRTYSSHMGAIVYSNTTETRAGGVLMTDVNGGIWLTHSIPGFPDLTKPTAVIPEPELGNGQLIICISTTLEEQQTIYEAIKLIKPEIVYKHLSHVFYRDSVQDYSKEIRTIELPNIAQSAMILARPPGNPNCLYKKFAKDNSIILDVYGQSESKHRTTICLKNYGLRNIESISIKNEHEVHYFNGKFDRSKWAISTAAHWQLRGSGGTAYWTCTSNLDKHDDIGKGGLLFCIHDYGIWLTFDKLKVAEPECYDRGKN